jgi:hypothetical protein
VAIPCLPQHHGEDGLLQCSRIGNGHHVVREQHAWSEENRVPTPIREKDVDCIVKMRFEMMRMVENIRTHYGVDCATMYSGCTSI